MNMSKQVCSKVASEVPFETAWVIALQHDIFQGATVNQQTPTTPEMYFVSHRFVLSRKCHEVAIEP